MLRVNLVVVCGPTPAALNRRNDLNAIWRVDHSGQFGGYLSPQRMALYPTGSAFMMDDRPNPVEADPFRSWFSFGRVSPAMQWRGQPIEQTNDYYLAVIEFDEQGWFQDLGQRSEFERFLREKAQQNEHLLIVVFIHGWKHNAAADDTSLQSFRGVLRDARFSEDRRSEDRGRDRKVLGVYLSWRGLSLSGNELSTNASFWARKKAASKVAVGSIREILARLRAFQIALNKTNDHEGPDEGTRLIIAGHSFGGLILFTAVSRVSYRKRRWSNISWWKRKTYSSPLRGPRYFDKSRLRGCPIPSALRRGASPTGLPETSETMLCCCDRDKRFCDGVLVPIRSMV
jgi:hypothetical protein